MDVVEGVVREGMYICFWLLREFRDWGGVCGLRWVGWWRRGGGKVGNEDIGIPVRFRWAFSIVYCFVALGECKFVNDGKDWTL